MHSMIWSILLAGCAGPAQLAEPPAAAPAVVDAATSPLRLRSDPMEYVGVTLRQEVDLESFHALAGGIFGEAARGGALIQDLELSRDVLLSAAADPRSRDQAIVTLEMLPSPIEFPDGADPRTILQVPVSFDYGEVFIAAVDAAMREADRVATEMGADELEPWQIEHRTRSPMGGQLTITVQQEPGESAVISFETQGARTSLTPGEINQPAFDGRAYETVAGTVYFHLTRDQFDFFSVRAYGFTAGADQNFDDFALFPHNWLRLTVTPRLEEALIDVGFEVLTPGGERVHFAKAPASAVAGDQFRQNVYRLVDNMLAAEETEPGSSTPFSAPFHYDDPDGGGIVRVVTHGEGGVFRVAYEVESPRSYLQDVEFLPYAEEIDLTVAEAPNDDGVECGAPLADDQTGTFQITFDASSTVRKSRKLKAELEGDIWGSVFRAKDVRIYGPIKGAESVADFALKGVDLRDPAALVAYTIEAELPPGEYQILGFIDIDQNANDTPSESGGAYPDAGDPVTVPIGGYELACAEEPVVVEFAILNPG